MSINGTPLPIILGGNMSVQIKTTVLQKRKSNECQLYRHERSAKSSCRN